VLSAWGIVVLGVLMLAFLVWYQHRKDVQEGRALEPDSSRRAQKTFFFITALFFIYISALPDSPLALTVGSVATLVAGILALLAGFFAPKLAVIFGLSPVVA